MPVKIFFCYAHEDEALLEVLKKHLSPLRRQDLIDVWYDRDIRAGSEWGTEISKHLDAANIILLLVSPDFMDSEYCYGIEMKRALQRHERKEARVIPIILRPIYWQGTLGTLQALPKDALPVLHQTWHTLDDAFHDVAESIRRVVEELTPQLTLLNKQVHAFSKTQEMKETVPQVQLERIGPYTISSLASRSSTSSFYHSTRGKKDVIIKRLNVPLLSSEAKDAFQKRAVQLKKLKHRGILDTQTFDFDGDFGYLVMERRDGETLRQFVPNDTLYAAADIRTILSPIADALHYAHVQNTLHTNLHPSSLSIDTRKNPFLTEFSLNTPGITLDDEAFAIPYMAPEHLQGLPVAASDQYALAVMVYEWLCGRRPFKATERDLLLEQQKKAAFPAPSSINTTVSSIVDRVLIQALAYKFEERFPTVQAFADAYLKALLGVVSSPKVRPISPS